MITDNKYYLEKIKQQQAEIDELRKRIKKSIDILNKKPNELTYNDAMYAIMELKGTTNEQ